jgi:hypothetical protein
MRSIISIIGCLLVISATAQSVEKQQYIKLTYTPNRAYVEQAVERIEAVNTILPQTTVEYRAGQAVELLPGFQADKGSIFAAHIKSVAETDIQLSAFPNPFDKSTTIDFELPEAGSVNLFVVDAKGQIVERLLENSQQSAGRHQLEWKADAFSSGVYIPVLKTGKQQVSSRIIKK